MREKDKLHHILEVRDQENATLQGIIQTLREESPKEVIVSDRTISTVARASPVKTPKFSKNMNPKPFSSPNISKTQNIRSRHSTGEISVENKLLNEESRSKVDLESICKPTFSSTQHYSPPKEPSPEPNNADSPPQPLPMGSYKKGTIKAMATPRSRDAMMKHQVIFYVGFDC